MLYAYVPAFFKQCLKFDFKAIRLTQELKDIFFRAQQPILTNLDMVILSS
jgi:hypothetical protein